MKITKEETLEHAKEIFQILHDRGVRDAEVVVVCFVMAVIAGKTAGMTTEQMKNVGIEGAINAIGAHSLDTAARKIRQKH